MVQAIMKNEWDNLELSIVSRYFGSKIIMTGEGDTCVTDMQAAIGVA